jgi:hypothetical protein
MQDSQALHNVAQILRPVPFPPNASSPIFVLGSVRSGTSAVGQALTRGAGIPGKDEGHVNTLLQMASEAVDRVVGNFPASGGRYLINDFDHEAFKLHMRNFVAAFFAQRCPAGRWADKSPDDFPTSPSIRSAPMLLELFPNARFVYCLRRGIENVLSRTTKFPQVPFWYHCRSWATTVVTWHEVRGQLGDRWIEVRQEELALQPAKVAEAMARFLGFDKAQHAGLKHSFEQDRPEQSRPAGEGHALSLEETGWDKGLRDVFLRECSQAMELAGYELGGGARTDGGALKLFCASAESSSSTELRGVPAARHRPLNRDDFTLGPAPRGTRAMVTYRDLVLASRTRFTAAPRVQGPSSLLVEFGIEIRNQASIVVATGSVRVHGGRGSSPLDVRIPAGNHGVCTATIWTEVIEGEGADSTQAEWRAPAFQS